MMQIVKVIAGLLVFTLIGVEANAQTDPQIRVVVIPLGGDEGPTSKAVFITQGSWDGNLGGPTGADALCQTEADSIGSKVQGLPFKAWVSGLSTDFTAGGRTFVKSTLPYMLVDGTLVADNYADLVDGDDLVADIDVDAGGIGFATLINVWTGISNAGLISPGDCNAWTSNLNTIEGYLGDSQQFWGTWTDQQLGFGSACDQPSHLYCFEQ